MELNNSTHFKGEDIVGHFLVTTSSSDDQRVNDLTGTVFQLIVKASTSDSDEDALANLTNSSGLTITAVSTLEHKIDFEIPGEATEGIVKQGGRSGAVPIQYEFNATYLGKSQADVLERGTININPDRVLSSL